MLFIYIIHLTPTLSIMLDNFMLIPYSFPLKLVGQLSLIHELLNIKKIEIRTLRLFSVYKKSAICLRLGLTL